eukprot:SAG31_NODE_2040_length_6591_cov_8.808996_7_plen_42_part_00
MLWDIQFVVCVWCGCWSAAEAETAEEWLLKQWLLMAGCVYN